MRVSEPGFQVDSWLQNLNKKTISYIVRACDSSVHLCFFSVVENFRKHKQYCPMVKKKLVMQKHIYKKKALTKDIINIEINV